MKIIERKKYLNRLIRLKDTPDIIITGLRRSGKYGIKEEALLDSLTDYMMDNISNLTSASKISNVFKQNKVETNHITIIRNTGMFRKEKW